MKPTQWKFLLSFALPIVYCVVLSSVLYGIYVFVEHGRGRQPVLPFWFPIFAGVFAGSLILVSYWRRRSAEIRKLWRELGERPS